MNYNEATLNTHYKEMLSLKQKDFILQQSIEVILKHINKELVIS